MSDNVKKNIRQIYGIVLSAMLIITGILLMVACVNIYKIGNRPFTPENISTEFSKISVFVWITVTAVIIGIALEIAIPKKREKLRAATDKKITLSRMLSRVDMEKVSKELVEKNNKEKKFRSFLRIEAIILCVAAAIPALIYSLNMNNFDADYNTSVILAFVRIFASALVALGISIAYIILENKSLDRQLKCAKEMLTDSRTQLQSANADKPQKSQKTTFAIRISITAVAILFIVIGIFNGGMADVLAKAINICTECIGLG